MKIDESTFDICDEISFVSSYIKMIVCVTIQYGSFQFLEDGSLKHDSFEHDFYEKESIVTSSKAHRFPSHSMSINPFQFVMLDSDQINQVSSIDRNNYETCNETYDHDIDKTSMVIEKEKNSKQ